MVAGGVGLAPFVTLAEALIARGTPMTLFYGARRAADLHCADIFERLGVPIVFSTEDGSRGIARASSPFRSTSALGASLQPSEDVRLYVCGPTPMMRAVADVAATHGRRCDVSLEQVMGCGMGGCYSCVVPARDAARRAASHQVLHRRPGFRRHPHRLGSAGALNMDLSVSIGSLRDPQPAHRRQRMLRLRRRIRRRGGSRRRSAASRSRDCFSPPARGTRRRASSKRPSGMLNAIGLQGIGVHRFIDEKLPELRARKAIVFVNICGTTIDEYVELARILSDAEGVHAIELNISCPNIKEGGITFGCSLTGHPRRRQRRPQGDAAAADPQADAERHRRGVVRARVRRSRRRRGVAGQHLPRDGDRRRDPAAEADQHRRRTERTGDPADRRADGLRVPAGGEAADHRHGRDRDRRGRPRVHDRRARTPSRSARPTSSIRSSGRSCSTASTPTCRGTRSRGCPT